MRHQVLPAEQSRFQKGRNKAIQILKIVEKIRGDYHYKDLLYSNWLPGRSKSLLQNVKGWDNIQNDAIRNESITGQNYLHLSK